MDLALFIKAVHYGGLIILIGMGVCVYLYAAYEKLSENVSKENRGTEENV